MKKFFKDFKEFISRGNVLDLAVAVIVGGAFQKIVTSLVNDLLMPIIGVIGGVNISEAGVVLVPETEDAAAVVLKYGNFIQTIIDFLIIALTIFVIIRVLTGLNNKAKGLVGKKRKKSEATVTEPEVVVEPEPIKPNTEVLLEEIRDLLKDKK